MATLQIRGNSRKPASLQAPADGLSHARRRLTRPRALPPRFAQVCLDTRTQAAAVFESACIEYGDSLYGQVGH